MYVDDDSPTPIPHYENFAATFFFFRSKKKCVVPTPFNSKASSLQISMKSLRQVASDIRRIHVYRFRLQCLLFHKVIRNQQKWGGGEIICFLKESTLHFKKKLYFSQLLHRIQ